MQHFGVRKGMTNAQFNERSVSFLSGEIFLISIIVGIVTQSWWWGGGAFLGLIIGFSVKILAIPLVVLLSALWGFLGVKLGAWFGSNGAMAVLGLFFFLGSIGVHFSALQWFKDLEIKANPE